MDREERRLAREDQNRKEELQAQIEMKKMELECQQAKVNARRSQDGSGDEGADEEPMTVASRRATKGPKLLFFDDSRDNIDSYLRRFERYAELQRWPKADWALYLSALLKGKSLKCYSMLAEPDARDYDKLKAALMRRFDLTTEGFRKKFYDAKRDKDETAAQFTVRLAGYLDRWIQLAETECTYEGLRALLIRERFLDSCDNHLSLYLRERSPKSLDEVVTLADNYIDAQSNKIHSAKKWWNKKPVAQVDNVKETSFKGSSMLSAHREQKSSTNGGQGSKIVSAEQRVCYHCSLPGHLKRNCKLRWRVETGAGNDTAAACDVVDDSKGTKSKGCPHSMTDRGGVLLNCGCELPYVGSVEVRQTEGVSNKQLAVVQDQLGDQVVSCLRDTGCTTGVIRSSLVQPSQMTGRRKIFSHDGWDFEAGRYCCSPPGFANILQ